MKLADRIAIVTGAAKGMGRDICLTLAREGASLAIAAREARPLEALGVEISAIGRRAIAVPTDVTDEPAVERLVARARLPGVRGRDGAAPGDDRAGHRQRRALPRLRRLVEHDGAVGHGRRRLGRVTIVDDSSLTPWPIE